MSNILKKPYEISLWEDVLERVNIEDPETSEVTVKQYYKEYRWARYKVKFTRNDFLNYSFVLPADATTFTLKIEYNAPCWAQMKVNDEVYDQFVSKIYHENEESETEVVELTFDVNEFESLDLRNGNNRGHRYYINNQEVPLTDEDKNTNQDRPVDVILTLEKE